MTHCNSLGDAPMSLWIEGSAKLAELTSTNSMNSASNSTVKAMQLRGTDLDEGNLVMNRS